MYLESRYNSYLRYCHIRSLEYQLSWTLDQMAVNNKIRKVDFISSRCTP